VAGLAHLSHPTIFATKQCNGAAVPSCPRRSDLVAPRKPEQVANHRAQEAGKNISVVFLASLDKTTKANESNRLFTSAASELCELKHHHLPLLSNSFETKFGYPLPVQISSLINL
jgi:hypothetical protein